MTPGVSWSVHLRLLGASGVRLRLLGSGMRLRAALVWVLTCVGGLWSGANAGANVNALGAPSPVLVVLQPGVGGDSAAVAAALGDGSGLELLTAPDAVHQIGYVRDPLNCSWVRNASLVRHTELEQTLSAMEFFRGLDGEEGAPAADASFASVLGSASDSASASASASQSQSALNWGVDRLDGTMENGVAFPGGGLGSSVDVYVLDTGVRATHVAFAGAGGKSRVRAGWDVVAGGIPGDAEGSLGRVDCDGHGTHVASLAAGRGYGVAREAGIVPVRVLDCSGRGPNSDVVRGIEWASGHTESWASGRKRVINLSVGASRSAVINAAVENAHARGHVVVVSAGNEYGDACWRSPASAASAVTVGAVEQTDRTRSWTLGVSRAGYSNFGSCVDVFAPGSFIWGASHLDDFKRAYKGGTSMASPFVAGVIALTQDRFPLASREEVLRAVLSGWVEKGVVRDGRSVESNLVRLSGATEGWVNASDPSDPVPVPGGGGEFSLGTPRPTRPTQHPTTSPTPFPSALSPPTPNPTTGSPTIGSGATLSPTTNRPSLSPSWTPTGCPVTSAPIPLQTQSPATLSPTIGSGATLSPTRSPTLPSPLECSRLGSSACRSTAGCAWMGRREGCRYSQWCGFGPSTCERTPRCVLEWGRCETRCSFLLTPERCALEPVRCVWIESAWSCEDI